MKSSTHARLPIEVTLRPKYGELFVQEDSGHLVYQAETQTRAFQPYPMPLTAFPNQRAYLSAYGEAIFR